MIQSSFIGYLSKDAKLVPTRNGNQSLNFSTAVSQGSGHQSHTEWVQCSLVGKKATQLAQYLLKGSKVFISGELKKRDYQGNNGQSKTSLSVNVSNIQFLSNSKNDSQPTQAAQPIQQQPNPFPQTSIGRVTQMLAHDVRKPFSMMKGTLSSIMDSKSPAEIQSVVSDSIPQIDRAITSVNLMISDVMEVGRETKLGQEEAEIQEVIQNVVEENVRISDVDIHFEYKFDHSKKAYIDVGRISRVFSNIIGNAFQAMKNTGKMWFYTKATMISNKPFVELTIGNSGSYIPPEDLDKLFEAFYTKNKKSGTGLGLAIAKKITEAHGGTIRCESDEKKGVEFIIVLPLTDKPCRFVGKMLTHSKDFVTKKLEMKVSDDQEVELDTLPAIQTLKSLLAEKEMVSILIADDERLYRQIIERHVEWIKDPRVTLDYCENAASALEMAQTKTYDLIILDVDMGARVDGFSIAKTLRNSNCKSFICIHSNRGLMDYQSVARDAGADLFVPKPMSKTLFIKVLLSSFGNPDELMSVFENSSKEGIHKKLNLVVIDDEAIFLKSWGNALKNESPTLFHSAEEAISYFKTKPQVDALITDYYLGDLTGSDVARAFLNEFPNKPVFLSSNMEQNRANDLFTANVSKIPVDAWPKIRSLINENDEEQAEPKSTLQIEQKISDALKTFGNIISEIESYDKAPSDPSILKVAYKKKFAAWNLITGENPTLTFHFTDKDLTAENWRKHIHDFKAAQTQCLLVLTMLEDAPESEHEELLAAVNSAHLKAARPFIRAAKMGHERSVTA